MSRFLQIAFIDLRLHRDSCFQNQGGKKTVCLFSPDSFIQSGFTHQRHCLLPGNPQRCAQAVKDFLGFSEPKEGPLSNFHTYAPDMMDLYAKGIDDNADKVKNSVTDVANSIAGSFSADIGYNLPDIAGYAADLSAMITATSSTEIVVPLNVDGREIARASAWYMNEQLAWEAR